jgi:hypothetical protein
MFIANTGRQGPLKLQRSGMYSCFSQAPRDRQIHIHAAPLELGWASGVLVTINMALLTELDRPRSRKCV